MSLYDIEIGENMTKYIANENGVIIEEVEMFVLLC